jgi:inorganic pyrophosphatase
LNLLRGIPVGDEPPAVLNVVVEVAAGSRVKYEYDPDWETLVLDRVLHSSVVFPIDYGFVPQTWFTDDDPLDAMVLGYEPLHVGNVVKARTLGALVMEDEKGDDTKILGAPIGDPRFEGYKSLSDVHQNQLREIQDFFEFYKRLEPRKWVKFREWVDADAAKKIVQDAALRYEQKFPRGA